MSVIGEPTMGNTSHPVSYFSTIICVWLIVQGIITIIRGCPISRDPSMYTPESLKKFGRPMGILMTIGGGLFLFLQLDFHDIFTFSIPFAFVLLGIGFLTIIIYIIILTKGLKKR